MIRDTLGSWTMWFTDRVTDPRLVLQYKIEKLSDALERFKVNKIKAEEELKKIDRECKKHETDRDRYIANAKAATNEDVRESSLDAAYYLEVAIQSKRQAELNLRPIVDDYDKNTQLLREQIEAAKAKLSAVEAMILAKDSIPEEMRIKNAEINADIERAVRMAKRQTCNVIDNPAVNIDKEAWKKKVME